MAEVLIVVAVAAILAIAGFFGVMVQISKARDARRKADLDALRIALEDWSDDHGRFPTELELPGCGQGFDRYLKEFPCDPVTGNKYIYVTGGNWFKVYTKLAWGRDPVIADVGCGSGCGPGKSYNYGVASGDVRVGDELVEEGIVPTCGGPGNWFCYPNIWAECCPGSGYRCNGNGTRCILDSSCG